MNFSTRVFLHPAVKGLICLTLILGSPLLYAQGIHISLRANLNPSPGTNSYSDVVAEGNFAYVSSWHNTSGVWIFDVSQPSNPQLVTRYAPSGTSLNMQGIQVLNGIGYFADDSGGGIHIVDLSNPAQPKLITRITSAQGGYNSVHDLTLSGDGHMFVPNYRVNDDVQVWDVSNPTAPVLQTTLTGTDTLSVHDVTVQNNRLFMSGWGGQVDIWDITNLPSATRLGSFFSGFHTQDISVTSDGNFLACPRELSSNGDVGIFDISDPANVVRVATITQPGWGISATSPSTSKIMGNFLFVAWYQAGLVVFDISNPANPVMVGNYDTWTGFSFGGTGGGDGDWGVWPFLGLDRVLVSDRTTGLYIFDATGVSSQPAAFALSFNPSSLLGSKSTTGTAYILGSSPSPDGMTLNLSSNNPAVNPGTVFIPAGAHSATFTQSTTSVTSKTAVTVTQSDGTYSAAGSLTLTPPQPVSLLVSPSPVRGGLSAKATVTFNAAVAVDTTVSLAVVSGGSAIASTPASVVVPAGFTSANWMIQTIQLTAPVMVAISATANGATKNGFFTVSAITPSSLSFAPSTVRGGNTTVGTVSFPAPVNQDTVVTLGVVSGAGTVASIPGTITVTAGTSSTTFAVGTNPVSTSTVVTLSATANGVTKNGSFTVNAITPSSLSFAPNPVRGGNTTVATLYFTAPVNQDTVVTLAVVSGASAVTSIPGTVTVTAGNSSTTFAVGTNQLTAPVGVTISATANGVTKNGSFTVSAITPSSLTFAPSPVRGGNTTVGTVSFPAPVNQDTVVTLAVVSGASAVSSLPGMVTVTAGSSSTTFAVGTNQLTAPVMVTISATANGATKNGFFTVSAITPSSLSFAPSTVTGGNTTVGTVSFPVPVNQDTVVTLAVVSGASAVASVPGTITVTAGTSSTTFAVGTNPVSTSTVVTLSATANGGTKNSTFTVK